MPTDNALEWIEDHVILFSLFSKTLPEQNSFLDALASLDLKLSVSQSLMFFGFAVNQVM